MPDIVNDDDLSTLAAEYVLGTLDGNERTRANVLLDVDHQFLSLVRIWERRLGELHLMVEPVEPETKIWQRIRGKLKNVAPIPVSPAPVPAPPPAAPPRMPTSAPFTVAPAPVPPLAPAAKVSPASAPPAASASLESKPVSAPTTTGHKLASLIQEVEKVSADAKLAERMNAGVNTAEPQIAVPTAPETTLVDSTPGGSEGVVKEAEEPAQPAQWAPAEGATLDLSRIAPEPRPTVAELAAKLAPEPAESDRNEPRQVDRVRREQSLADFPDSTRKQAGRPGMGRAARPPSIGLWRSVAALMLLVSMALGSLIALWRYMPERLPERLRPMAVLNLSDVTSSLSRRPVPIEAEFDE